jgi:hypothetical protein
MSRTSKDAVLAVLGDNYDVERALDLQPFMDTASSVVDRVVTCATTKGITLSTTEQEITERWLAAHFYAVNDPLYTSRSTGGASGSFQTGTPDKGFSSTEYGRQSLALDYSGCLENISKKQRAKVFWLGKNPSQQIPYSQRR